MYFVDSLSMYLIVSYNKVMMSYVCFLAVHYFQL